MNIPELLAPAGSPEALDAACAAGADAVYLGLKTFNARLRGANFAYSQYEAALSALHRRKMRLYAALNTVWTEREAPAVYSLLAYFASTGCDGVIVQDFGSLRFCAEHFPRLSVHASTQMNIASSDGCNLLSKYGVSRVVLSRELSLDEIRAIRARTTVELEVFVHGALCVSASGLCLFSSYLGGKSANRGMCTQACRRRYTPEGGEAKYYFSPLDLQLVEKIPGLVMAGVHSLKIEGRMKSADYTGNTVAAYRIALDALAGLDANQVPEEDGRYLAALEKAKNRLHSDFAREKTFFHFEGDAPGRHLNADTDGGTGVRLGLVARTRGAGKACEAYIKNAPRLPRKGDSIRLHRADDSRRATWKIHALRTDGENSFWLDIPAGFGEGDSVYLTQTKEASLRAPPILPSDLKAFHKTPRRLCAPEAPPVFKRALSFPEGIYAAVSRIEDLYIAQAARPERLILHIDRAAAARLIRMGAEKQALPFKSSEMILSLDPFFNEGERESLSIMIPELFSLGYRAYIVNNLGHIPVCAACGEGLEYIAGPWLYTFNQSAAAFIADTGAAALVTPLENARQNLERSFPQGERGRHEKGGAPARTGQRARVFVTVFAYPPLFTISSPLKQLYSFRAFEGARGERFSLAHGSSRSVVTPEAPFSITDKIPFLRAAGFKRFILDFSPNPLRKILYKETMRAAREARLIAGGARFNWKNGFYESKDG
jgi:putative protease